MEDPGAVSLVVPSGCVAGSGVPVVSEQATKLPDRSNATVAMENHFLFMFIPLSFIPWLRDLLAVTPIS